jgi:hypothetical protein
MLKKDSNFLKDIKPAQANCTTSTQIGSLKTTELMAQFEFRMLLSGKSSKRVRSWLATIKVGNRIKMSMMVTQLVLVFVLQQDPMVGEQLPNPRIWITHHRMWRFLQIVI